MTTQQPQQPQPYRKPLPVLEPETRPFWEAAARREYMLKRCSSCKQFHYPPQNVCPHCLSSNTVWIRGSGYGKVYSYTITYQGGGPGYAEEVPFVLGIIELDEGVRVWSNVVGIDPKEVKVGMVVEAVFENVAGQGIAIPRFRPRPQKKA